MNTSIIDSAREYSQRAHDSIGQVRKYTGAPYWTHTNEVALIVSEIAGSTTAMIAAAHLHDVIEDVFPQNPQYSLEDIRAKFGELTAAYVNDLTDVFTKDNYPKLNRKIRKANEAERLGKIPSEAQTIKLADLIANSRDILVQDEGFARTYIQEERALLCKLTKGNHYLWRKAANQCAEAYEKLGLTW